MEMKPYILYHEQQEFKEMSLLFQCNAFFYCGKIHITFLVSNI